MHAVPRDGRRGARERRSFERAAIPISLKNGDGTAAAASRWRNGRKQRKERKGKEERKRRDESGVGWRGWGGEAIEKRTGGGVGVLEGSVCRVAWPIVCKGSRSSSKEPAEEEEEGSEAN